MLAHKAITANDKEFHAHAWLVFMMFAEQKLVSFFFFMPPPVTITTIHMT